MLKAPKVGGRYPLLAMAGGGAGGGEGRRQTHIGLPTERKWVQFAHASVATARAYLVHCLVTTVNDVFATAVTLRAFIHPREIVVFGTVICFMCTVARWEWHQDFGYWYRSAHWNPKPHVFVHSGH